MPGRHLFNPCRPFPQWALSLSNQSSKRFKPFRMTWPVHPALLELGINCDWAFACSWFEQLLFFWQNGTVAEHSWSRWPPYTLSRDAWCGWRWCVQDIYFDHISIVPFIGDMRQPVVAQIWGYEFSMVYRASQQGWAMLTRLQLLDYIQRTLHASSSVQCWWVKVQTDKNLTAMARYIRIYIYVYTDWSAQRCAALL